MDLTFKQRLFVGYYLGESQGNATDAARRAGYKHPNVAGPRLLVNASIRAAVETRLTAHALSSDEVLARLSEHASGDLTDFGTINPDGSFSLDLRRAKKAGRTRLLKKLKVKTRTVTTDQGESVEVQTEIELHSPQFALDRLGQYHGLFAPKEAKAGPDEHPIAKALRKAAESLEERPG